MEQCVTCRVKLRQVIPELRLFVITCLKACHVMKLNPQEEFAFKPPLHDASTTCDYEMRRNGGGYPSFFSSGAAQWQYVTLSSFEWTEVRMIVSAAWTDREGEIKCVEVKKEPLLI